jgi:tRNA pseudouridine38-40 synthase
MQRYKLIISYDGTAYHGWQKQQKHATIAGTLEQRFYKVFGHHIELSAASRTDAGVHALGQIATFQSSIVLDPEKFRLAWNGRLPADILIKAIEPVSESFHVQYDVLSKTYWYHVATHRPLPFFARYCYWYRFPFDVEKLKKYLNLFVGTHDFRSFCTGDEQESTVRTVEYMSVEPMTEIKGYKIVVKGPGFLRYMIRRIIGAALYASSHKVFSEGDILRVLHAANPAHEFPTAPAKGLMLFEIEYRKKS